MAQCTRLFEQGRLNLRAEFWTSNDAGSIATGEA
jgi:hypothetical protein